MKPKPRSLRSTTSSLSARPWRFQHDTIMEALQPPYWLIGGDLRADTWICETDDPKARLETKVRIDFTVPIAPGPVRLDDERHAHDLLTAKLYFTTAYPLKAGLTQSRRLVGRRTLCWTQYDGARRMDFITFDILFQNASNFTNGNWPGSVRSSWTIRPE